MQTDNIQWKLLFGKGSNNSGRNVYVQERHFTRWNQLKQDHLGNYYLTTLLRAVQSLNALAKGRTGRVEVLTMDSGQLQYEVNKDGDVLVWLLKIDDSMERPAGDQSTGLYRVRYATTEDKWKIHGDAQSKMDISHRWNNVHYAAVSGKFSSKEEAGATLSEHIRNAFKAAISQPQMDKPRNHYSLYWQNGSHRSERQRDDLTSLIQQAQTAKASVNWLVHGTGAITFTNALKVLETYPSLTRFQAQDEEIVRNLRQSTELQGVYFSNPRGMGVTEKELKRLCDKVGIRLVGINRDDHDLLNSDSLKAAANKCILIGSKAGVGGSLSALGLSNVVKSLELSLDASTAAAAGALALGGIVIAKDTLSTLGGYARSVGKSWGSTVGKGNQRWSD